MSLPLEITLDMMREKLYAAVVSDALDALGYRKQSPKIPLLPQTSEDVLIGRCKTTLWEDIDFEDPCPYELELLAIDSCQPDDVMICAAQGSTRSGVWGELLSTAAKNRGCVGAIIHGSIRDTAKIKALGFTVYATGRSVYDSMNRQRVMSIDEPVKIEGVTFCAGDLVIADSDGVVVVPREIENQAIKKAWEKVNEENITRDAITNGLSVTEAYKKYGVL